MATDGLAWDWVNEKLYWTDAENRTIEVLDPATGERMILFFTGDDTIPRGVAIDPNTRLELASPLKAYNKHHIVPFI